MNINCKLNLNLNVLYWQSQGQNFFRFKMSRLLHIIENVSAVETNATQKVKKLKIVI